MRFRSFKRRSAAALAAAGVALGAAIAMAPAAAASASGCSNGSAYGVNITTCFDAHGSGYYLYYVKIYAKPQLSGQPLDFPNFVGCGVHGQLYNTLSGSAHRNWDTPRVTCSNFTSSGAAFIVSVYTNVPGGTYCTRLWVDNNGGGYASPSAACFSVHG